MPFVSTVGLADVVSRENTVIGGSLQTVKLWETRGCSQSSAPPEWPGLCSEGHKQDDCARGAACAELSAQERDLCLPLHPQSWVGA